MVLILGCYSVFRLKGYGRCLRKRLRSAVLERGVPLIAVREEKGSTFKIHGNFSRPITVKLDNSL